MCELLCNVTVIVQGNSANCTAKGMSSNVRITIECRYVHQVTGTHILSFTPTNRCLIH